MTDKRLADLFAEGTAPERDAAFARRVDSQIGRARLGRRFVLPMRRLAPLTLVGAIFMTVRAIQPTLERMAESSPQLMGVPLPLVVGLLSVGLIVYARRLISFH